MSFELTPEQLDLKELIGRFLKEESRSILRGRIDRGIKFDRDLWRKIRDLGVLSIFDPESGFSSGGIEIGIVSKECGRYLLSEELSDGVVAGVILREYLLEKGEKDPELLGILKEVLDGAERAVVLPSLQGCVEPITIAREKERVYVSGEVPFAFNTVEANYGLVPFIFSGYKGDFATLIFSLDKKYCKATPLAGIDLTRNLYSYTVRKSPAYILISRSGAVLPLLAALSKASELSGICEAVVDLTTDYVKNRRQFGVPIGSFQGVSHKLAEMKLYSEALSSLSEFAGWSADHSKEQFSLAVRSALYFGCEVAPKIAEDAVQLHGGIGFTWEYDLHLYLRRVKAIEALWGDKAEQAAGLLSSLTL